MRAFEVALISVNVLSLLLGFKKQAKSVWVGAAGLNIVVFLAHALFEGIRYQLLFSYIFVVLFAVVAFAKTNPRFIQAKTPKPLKVIAISLAFLLLGLTSFLALALPVFTLSKPSGSDAVGIQYFHLVDENRLDPFLDRSPQKRALAVKVYYPARDELSKPYYPYFHNSPGLVKRFAAFYNMPGFMFDQLNLVKTNSKEGLALSDQQPSYPVVLFSHGAGTSIEVQTSQSEDLASHGYIVVAIDHTYVSAAAVFPDRIVSHHDATTNFDVVEPAEIITQIMAADAQFVIDQLIEINAGRFSAAGGFSAAGASAPDFQGKLNLDRIGVVGHSVGGAVAYNLAVNDPRVKAAVNLDGVVYITPEAGSPEIAPFLMLASDRNHIQAFQNRENLMRKYADMPSDEQNMVRSIYGSAEAYQQAYNTAQQNLIGLIQVLKASGNLYTITGSDHMKFTDIGLFIGVDPLRQLFGIAGKTSPAKCLEITQSVTRTFFDQHLKGDASASLEALLKKIPELKKVELK